MVSTNNIGKGTPKEESHKQKEPEIMDEESKSEEVSYKVDKNEIIFKSSTSKELSQPSKKNKGFGFELHGEFKKIRPPIFYGEIV